LALLLKNQDNYLLVTQTNLASCQSELNFAEHDKQGHATPMRNIAPEFKGHPRTRRPAPSAADARQPAAGGATTKPGAIPPAKPQ
jgi:hypothetical protein